MAERLKTRTDHARQPCRSATTSFIFRRENRHRSSQPSNMCAGLDALVELMALDDLWMRRSSRSWRQTLLWSSLLMALDSWWMRSSRSWRRSCGVLNALAALWMRISRSWRRCCGVVNALTASRCPMFSFFCGGRDDDERARARSCCCLRLLSAKTERRRRPREDSAGDER